jgi:predicted O-linked N-acetylglucosamine transferase (SPINDLY family)
MMLCAADAKELVAGGDDDYAAIAARLAADLPRLQSLRRELRQKMAASALCDASAFADALMERLRRAWVDWCAT